MPEILDGSRSVDPAVDHKVLSVGHDRLLQGQCSRVGTDEPFKVDEVPKSRLLGLLFDPSHRAFRDIQTESAVFMWENTSVPSLPI